MVMIFWLRVLIKIHHLHRQAMRTIRNLIVLQNWTRVFWPANEYTEGLPVAPGTVAWATLDTEHENCNINLTGISENDYNEYMELLNQEGFSVIENVSEEIEGENYVSIGTLLSNDEKWLSISYIPDSLTIYISFDNN